MLIPGLKISSALLWLKAVASQNVRCDRAVNKEILKKIKTGKVNHLLKRR